MCYFVLAMGWACLSMGSAGNWLGCAGIGQGCPGHVLGWPCCAMLWMLAGLVWSCLPLVLSGIGLGLAVGWTVLYCPWGELRRVFLALAVRGLCLPCTGLGSGYADHGPSAGLAVFWVGHGLGLKRSGLAMALTFHALGWSLLALAFCWSDHGLSRQLAVIFFLWPLLATAALDIERTLVWPFYGLGYRRHVVAWCG
jgi:hypothetical protein